MERRRLMNGIYVALFLYGSLNLYLFLNQRSFMYHPQHTRPDIVAAGVPGMESIAVQPAGLNGSVEGWYTAPQGDKPVILYFHGNGGNIDIRVDRVKKYIAQGYGILQAEYRGYGLNPGKPTESGLYADAQAYYDWLKRHTENRIIVYGESLGTGVATWLAERNPDVTALVLEAPYTSFPDIVRRHFFFVPVDLLMLDRYSSIGRIRNIKAPLLIIHGRKDNVVPFRLGEKLFNAANEPKTMRDFPDAGHNDLYDVGAAEVVMDFIGGLK